MACKLLFLAELRRKNMQQDLAIVICTVCRETLLRAVASIFAQSYTGTIQILIGIDVDLYGTKNFLQQAIFNECPDNIQINWIDVGYSTSIRHGGVHSCHFGGSLRTSLSFLANSKYVMYLDDDDWLAPSHCHDMLNVIQGKKWAYSYSIYADGNISKGICNDEIESVGVEKGIYRQKFDGFVRPSGLTINKEELGHILHLWSNSPYTTGDGEDRLIFEQLKKYKDESACTEKATVYYSLDSQDQMHQYRVNFIRSKGIEHTFECKKESVR